MHIKSAKVYRQEVKKITSSKSQSQLFCLVILLFLQINSDLSSCRLDVSSEHLLHAGILICSSTTFQACTRRSPEAQRDSTGRIPTQLMHNNVDGQNKQAQNKQWKVNKAAVTAQMLISAGKHRCTLSGFGCWLPSNGGDHPVYLAWIIRAAFNWGNVLTSHLQQTYLFNRWGRMKAIWWHSSAAVE